MKYIFATLSVILFCSCVSRFEFVEAQLEQHENVLIRLENSLQDARQQLCSIYLNESTFNIDAYLSNCLTPEQRGKYFACMIVISDDSFAQYSEYKKSIGCIIEINREQ